MLLSEQEYAPIFSGIDRQRKTYTYLFYFALIITPFFMGIGLSIVTDAIYPMWQRIAGLFVALLGPANIAATAYLLYKNQFKLRTNHPVAKLFMETPEKIAHVYEAVSSANYAGFNVASFSSLIIKTTDNKTLQIPVSRKVVPQILELTSKVAPNAKIGY